MEARAARARASARAPPGALSGPRCGVTDWDLGDAPTGKVRDAWMEDVPGTGHAAAITVQTVRSVGGGAPGPDHVSSAREPDRRQLEVHESWRGDGLRADRASARLARLRAGEAHAVPCVIRRNDHGQPPVDDIARGQVTQECFAGTDLDARLAEETRRRDGRVMDAAVPVGQGPQARPLRLVGVQTPQGYGCCLTHLPPRLGPRHVAALDRGRWEVARSLTWDTSVPRLDAITAARPGALQALRQASRIASMLAALLAPTHHLHTRPPPLGAPRPEAPLPPRRLAWQRAVSGQAIAPAFDLQGDAATRRWDKSAAWRTHAGRDPHGRRRPSVVAQLRGWKRQPMARHEGHRGDVSHGQIKAAASVDAYAKRTYYSATSRSTARNQDVW